MDLIQYYKSIGKEMDVLKNRIRNIMEKPHWQTDGEWKESVLRTILRRHVPESIRIGRGFVRTAQQCSSQIDVLIYDSSYPILFQDGELVVITPDAVRGIIEVKSQATHNVLDEAMVKLSHNANIIHSGGGNNCFIGLFTYTTKVSNHDWVLSKLTQMACGQRKKVITHVSLGMSHFFRYWDEDPQNRNVTNKWHSYRLENLAPAYFLNNVLSSLSESSILLNQDVWFPGETKERYKCAEISLLGPS
jgi:hypothetical protein